MERSIEKTIFSKEFGRQMRFIAGPRQAGKTTLAKAFLKKMGSPELYYNWDQREIRQRYRENPHFFVADVKIETKEKNWICFDEIHKMPKWKNILKDFFDSYENRFQFIVTGSARLDFFRKSGDSLAGRYFLFHLFPLTLMELNKKENGFPAPGHDAIDYIEARLSQHAGQKGLLEHLLCFSGFPEPFLNAKTTFHKKWQQSYLDRLVREDLRDLTRIHDLEHVVTLIHLLKDRINRPISLNSLREDMEVSYSAIKSYLHALKLCYIVFSISPYAKKIHRSLKKEPKLYFFDWTHIEDAGSRFENLVACELNTLVEMWNDSGLGTYTLHYVRTREKKETDFLIVANDKPWMLIEAKLSETQIEHHHITQAKLLGDIPFVQVIKKKDTCLVLDRKTYVVSAERFFT